MLPRPVAPIMLSIPACIIRGGTSKGLFFHRPDLLRVFGADRTRRDAFLARCLGSPDASGMQIDGVGGAISSTSKVCVLGPSEQPGFDLDWEFGQVAMDGSIDWKGSCGNLASALLLHARLLGIMNAEKRTVKVRQLVAGRQVLLEEREDKVAISGVPGRLEQGVEVTFLGDPEEASSLSLLPTGRVVDQLPIISGSTLVSLIGQPNPTVVVAASSAPAKLSDPSEAIDKWLEEVRLAGASAMEISPSPALRVAVLREPETYKTSSSEEILPGQADLYAMVTSPGRRWHHAITGTGASALSLAAQIPGTVAESFVSRANGPGSRAEKGLVTIAHPGGTITGRARVEERDGQWRVVNVGFVRTARLLFRGEVFAYPEMIEF